MKKSETRIIAEKIQSYSGLTLVEINFHAMRLVEMGLAANRLEALEELLKMEAI